MKPVSFPSIIRSLCLLLLLHGTYALFAQNVPNTQSAPAGSVSTFEVPPSLPLQGEGVGYNYTRTFIPTVPITDPQAITENSLPSEVRISTTFSDGFNRSVQGVVRYFTNTDKPHLVIPYDTRFQSEPGSYPGYATAVDNSIATDPLAGYHANAFTEQKNFYNSLYPAEGYTSFGRQQYLSDAGQRSTIAYSAGKSQVGQGRGVKTQVIFNNAAEIRVWTLDGNGLPVTSGYYPADRLQGSLTTDSEGGEVYSYTDREGRMVCSKVRQTDNVVGGGGAVPVYGITYYVYDKLGHLCYIIPPMATDLIAGGTLSATILEELCYQYRYNADGQLTERQLPGKAKEEYVYDSRKRLALYCNGEMHKEDQWSFTIYDALDRPLCTGLLTTTESREQLQVLLDNGNSYAAPSLFHYQKNYDLYHTYPDQIANGTIMGYTYYDDYSECDPDGAIWNTFTDVLQFSEQLSSAGAEQPWKGNFTKYAATGSRIRILPSNSADPSRTGEWRKTVSYYDHKGRLIYTVNMDTYQDDIIHAEYAGMQYDFAGRPLISKHVMYNANSADGITTHKELSRNIYDANSGRLTETRRKTDDGIWLVQSYHTYDALGRASRTVLGNYGEVRDFAYNIRGQLTGINAHYTHTGDRQGESRSFGEVLAYDYGFTVPRNDGQAAGMLWRGAGNSPQYAYGYDYDQGGRLTGADFRRLESNGLWRNDLADYSVSNLTYDKNGNIKTMDQRSVKPGGSVVTMDQLSYTYRNGGQSNQLLRVTDAAPFFELGDFNNTNGTADDYTYDLNGNLIADNNKQINKVTYDHLDRPVQIDFLNGSRIEYSYDAAGNKVQELVLEAGQSERRTDYINGCVFEGDKLKYISTAEGRSIFDESTQTFREEYFVTDHLGNIRSVVEVYVPPVAEYLATYEIASANLEGLVFDHLNEIRDERPGGGPGNEQAGSLNGSDPERRIGTSLLLKVMAGDQVEMNVNNFYEAYDPGNDSPIDPGEMLAAITGTLNAGVGGFIGSESHNTKRIDDLFTGTNYGVLDQLVNDNTDPGRPRAYLNYVMFDENMTIIPDKSGAFQANGRGTWTQIGTQVPVEIPANGYLAVYLSNASQNIAADEYGNVYFDQMVIRFSRGKLKEEAHYYPHGLPINGMGSTAQGYTPNKRKYQANDYNRELGLNWMDFHHRQYDPQLGRFLSVDPLAEATEGMSPYTAMNNNPVSVVDPLGLQGQSSLTHKLQWEFPYPKGYGPTPEKYNGPGSDEQKAQLQAEDDAREAAARHALAAAKKSEPTTGEVMGGFTMSMSEMAEVAMSLPGRPVGPGGVVLPGLEIHSDHTGSVGLWHRWGARMNERYGQSLGWDFRGYALPKSSWYDEGVRAGLRSTVEGVRHLFTWEGLKGIVMSQTIQGQVERNYRLAVLWEEVKNYDEYDRRFAAGYLSEKAFEIVLFSAFTAGIGSAATVEGEGAMMAANSSRTIIGETMVRVETTAARNPGSIILNDMPSFTGTPHQITSQMMTYNRQWLLQQMRSGRPILDIGVDPARKMPSIFYQMEQNMLKNYDKLHPGSLNIVKP